MVANEGIDGLKTVLIDTFHRNITYLRISITDRCNLRCRYCMPEMGVSKINHEDILTYEEFLKVVKAAASEGMTKVRLTGGEPLVRKGVIGFIRNLSDIQGIMDLRMTSNGVLLYEKAEELLDAGVKRINISLDSLKRDTFEDITGRDYLDRVWAGIEKAIDVGFDLIKINCVPIRGFNDKEIIDFAQLTMKMPVDVRFIEFMPLGHCNFWSEDKIVSTEEIKDSLGRLGELTPVDRSKGDGPARLFKLKGAIGNLGFISPVTDHFCATCNRLRLTADGKLRLCLLSDLEVDIKSSLRGGASIEELAYILREAVKSKPGRHHLQSDVHAAQARDMNLIGG